MKNEITGYALICLSLILFFYFNYLRVRNKRLKLFYDYILELCYVYDVKNSIDISKNIKKSAIENIYDKLPNYDKILFSFKPLQLQYWIDAKNRIELLSSNGS